MAVTWGWRTVTQFGRRRYIALGTDENIKLYANDRTYIHIDDETADRVAACMNLCKDIPTEKIKKAAALGISVKSYLYHFSELDKP